jgi:hypothetical protein
MAFIHLLLRLGTYDRPTGSELEGGYSQEYWGKVEPKKGLEEGNYK